MQTTQIIRDGKSQAVKLPKKYQFPGNKVGIKKTDEGVLLYSVDTVSQLQNKALKAFSAAMSEIIDEPLDEEFDAIIAQGVTL